MVINMDIKPLRLYRRFIYLSQTAMSYADHPVENSLGDFNRKGSLIFVLSTMVAARFFETIPDSV